MMNVTKEEYEKEWTKLNTGVPIAAAQGFTLDQLHDVVFNKFTGKEKAEKEAVCESLWRQYRDINYVPKTVTGVTTTTTGEVFVDKSVQTILRQLDQIRASQLEQGDQLEKIQAEHKQMMQQHKQEKESTTTTSMKTTTTKTEYPSTTIAFVNDIIRPECECDCTLTSQTENFFKDVRISSDLTNRLDQAKSISDQEFALQKIWSDGYISKINARVLTQKDQFLIGNRFLADIHTTMINGMEHSKPDIGLFAGSTTALSNCLCIIELKACNQEWFTTTHLSQLFFDSVEVLRLCPFRTFFFSVLLNQHNILIMKTFLKGERKKYIKIEPSHCQNVIVYAGKFTSAEGQQALTSFLLKSEEQLGYCIPLIEDYDVKVENYCIGDQIYCGSYKQRACLVKIVAPGLEGEHQKVREVAAVTKLVENGAENVPKILCETKTLTSRASVLVYDTVGESFKFHRLNDVHVDQLVAVLFKAHNLGIVHRGVSSQSLFYVSEKKVVLGEWQCAVFSTEKSERGSLVFPEVPYDGVCLEISSFIAGQKQNTFRPRPQDDLHALARAIFRLYVDINEHMFTTQDKIDYQKITNFWNKISDDPTWKTILELAESSDYTKMDTYNQFGTSIKRYLKNAHVISKQCFSCSSTTTC